MEIITSSILYGITKNLGDTGLIISAKATQFFSGQRITFEETERLLDILYQKENLADIKKMKQISVVLYFNAEFDPSKVTNFTAQLEAWINNKTTLRSSLSIDSLHLIFNAIEFEEKFKTLSQDKLKLLETQLSTYDKLEKPFEEYVLFKYYLGVLKFLQRDYTSTKMSIMDIVVDISEEIDNMKIPRSPLITFIELRNSILNIKVLEHEKDYREIMTYSECLFEQYKNTEVDLSIKVGFKMCEVHLTFYEYSKAFYLLQKMYKLLKKQMLFSNVKERYPDFIETNLNVLSRIVFCSILIGKEEDSIRYIKKIEKLLSYLKEFKLDNDPHKEHFITKYSFYVLIYKYISKYGTIDKAELNNLINSYKNKFKNFLNDEDETIINIYALNSSDMVASKFFDKISVYLQQMKSKNLIEMKFLPLYFSVYNQISVLTKNISTDTNVKKQLEYIIKLRDYAVSILDFTNKYVDSNYDLKFIFNYSYFKEVLIKIYVAYIFSFYFTKDYRRGLDIIDEFEGLKGKLDLDSGMNIKHYSLIMKQRADIYFKLEDYPNAVRSYHKVLQVYDDINNQTASALALLDLGLCYMYLKDINHSKENLNLSLNKFEILNKIHQNHYSDKISSINKLIDQLNLNNL